MATRKQILAAKRNIKKAHAARRKKKRGRKKAKRVKDFGGRKGLRRI